MIGLVACLVPEVTLRLSFQAAFKRQVVTTLQKLTRVLISDLFLFTFKNRVTR